MAHKYHVFTLGSCLIEVYICLSTDLLEADMVIKVTFRYIDLPGYYMIFRCTCLEEIHAILDMGP